MAFFDSTHQRAAWLVAILGVAIVIALAPYASGLLAAPVLYVIFQKMHSWLLHRLKSRSAASAIILVVTLVGIILPLGWMVTLLVGQAGGAARAILASPLISRLDSLHVGPFAIGVQLKQAASQAVSFLGGSAFMLLGAVTRVTLNLLFTLFGLYYILQDPEAAWNSVRPYIPFSDENVEILRDRFAAVTKSTVVGTGMSALIQGVLVAVAFMVTGLGNAVFWGAVTVMLAILPVLGSGMIWGPGAVVLFMRGETAWGIAMLVWGLVPVANVDNLIRPYVSNRYAQIHPLITLVGAVAGVSYLGLVGLLIGPLALSYFFELLLMYRREYLGEDEVVKRRRKTVTA